MLRRKRKNQKEERFVRSKIRTAILSILFLALSFNAHSQYSFTFNAQCLEAQKKSYELRLIPARAQLKLQADSFPNNLAIRYLTELNYFLEAFICEEPAKIKVYSAYRSNSIALYRKLDDTNPYKRFALAETYFYNAVLKGKQNELLSAARDIGNAYDYIEENAELFPSFIQNNKTRGILKAYLSSIPDNYSWATKILGFKGDLHLGMQLLKELANYQGTASELTYLSKEAAYYYGFSLLHVEHKPNTAWNNMLRFTSDYNTNNMSAFFRSGMALKQGRNEIALKTLEGRSRHDDYYPFHFLDYQLGIAKLNKLSIDAIGYLKKYRDNYYGTSYVKSCYQKISWYYLLAGDYENHRLAKSKISSVGTDLTEDDKLAVRYSKKDQPNRILLKARLLCDGGYYSKALAAMKEVRLDDLKNYMEKAEYCYRKGKIFEYIGETDVAMKFYEASRSYGKDSPEYYGAYSCLYLGDHYLKQGKKVEARKYYKLALGFKNNQEYKDSIEQRAKAGLKKLGT